MRIVLLQDADFFVGVVGIVRSFSRRDLEIHFFPEEAAISFQYHAGSIGFAVCRITGDVRSTNEDLVQQLPVDIRFVFPYVDDCSGNASFMQCCQDSLGVNDLST